MISGWPGPDQAMVYSVARRAIAYVKCASGWTVQDAAIDLGSWQITADGVREYLDAVGDGLPVYLETGTPPPLMLTARVVGRLLERLSLPDGAVHSLQDVETVNAPPIGAEVSATAQLEPARERGGMRFLTVNYSVADASGGGILQRGKTTVLLQAAADDGDGSANGTR